MFEFDLEIKLVYSNPAYDDGGSRQVKRLDDHINISGKVTEKSFEIPLDEKGRKILIYTFSIDS